MRWFEGFSNGHSSMVANVRHLTTGYISPQFHVVFDDLFEIVNCTGADDRVDESICNGLFQRNRELYAEDELDEVGNLFTNLLPFMKFGLMKQDATKVTRNVSISSVEMRI